MTIISEKSRNMHYYRTDHLIQFPFSLFLMSATIIQIGWRAICFEKDCVTVEFNVAEPPAIIPPRGTIAQIAKWTTDLCNLEHWVRHFQLRCQAISKREIKTKNNLTEKCSTCLKIVVWKRRCIASVVYRRLFQIKEMKLSKIYWRLYFTCICINRQI